MIHLTQLEHDTLKSQAAEAARLTVVTETLQQRLDNAVAALAECAKVHHENCLLGVQIRAAMAMAKSTHVPRRPLAYLLQREAEVVGAGLDSASLEQGEPA